MELTKEYFESYLAEQFKNVATKDDFKYLKGKVNALSLDMKEVKESINRIDNRDREDSNALAKDSAEYRRRITRLVKTVYKE